MERLKGMKKEFNEISIALIDLDNKMKHRIFSPFDLKRLHSIMQKITIRTNGLDKIINQLLLMDLDLNDDKVINVLLAIHKNLSQVINNIYAMRDLTTKMVSSYRKEWNKMHGLEE